MAIVELGRLMTAEIAVGMGEIESQVVAAQTYGGRRGWDTRNELLRSATFSTGLDDALASPTFREAVRWRAFGVQLLVQLGSR